MYSVISISFLLQAYIYRVVVIDVAGLVRSIIYCRQFVCSLRHRSLIRIYQSAKIPGQNQVRDRRQLINPV